MTTSKKKKNVIPYMVHLEPAKIKELKKYAKSESKSISAVVRNAVDAKLFGGIDPYRSGLINGLRMASEAAKATAGAQMKFPDGKSFADLVCEQIDKAIEKT